MQPKMFHVKQIRRLQARQMQSSNTNYNIYNYDERNKENAVYLYCLRITQ